MTRREELREVDGREQNRECNEEAKPVDLGLHPGSLALLMQAVSFVFPSCRVAAVYLNCSIYRLMPWQTYSALKPERLLFTYLVPFCLGVYHPSTLIFNFLSMDWRFIL